MQPGTLTLQRVQLGLRVTQLDLAYTTMNASSIEACPKLCGLPVDSAQTLAGLVARKQRLAGPRALALRLVAVLRRGRALLRKLGLLILVARGIASRGRAADAAQEAGLRRVALLRRARGEAEQRTAGQQRPHASPAIARLSRIWFRSVCRVDASTSAAELAS